MDWRPDDKPPVKWGRQSSGSGGPAGQLVAPMQRGRQNANKKLPDEPLLLAKQGPQIKSPRKRSAILANSSSSVAICHTVQVCCPFGRATRANTALHTVCGTQSAAYSIQFCVLQTAARAPPMHSCLSPDQLAASLLCGRQLIDRPVLRVATMRALPACSGAPSGPTGAPMGAQLGPALSSGGSPERRHVPALPFGAK